MNIITRVIEQSKMKPADVNSSTYIDCVEHNADDPNSKVGGLTKLKKYFCKRLHSKLVLRNFCD